MEGKVSYLSGSSACKSVCSYYQCCVVLQQLALHKLHKTSVSVTDIAALFYVSPITTMGIMQLQVTKDSAEKKKKEKKKTEKKGKEKEREEVEEVQDVLPVLGQEKDFSSPTPADPFTAAFTSFLTTVLYFLNT